MILRQLKFNRAEPYPRSSLLSPTLQCLPLALSPPLDSRRPPPTKLGRSSSRLSRGAAVSATQASSLVLIRLFPGSFLPSAKEAQPCHSLFYPLSKGTPVNLAPHLEQPHSTSKVILSPHVSRASRVIPLVCTQLFCRTTGGQAMMHDESYSLFLLHFLGAILYL